ncbi:MAG: hypothetical protein WBW80_06690 [Acidimicrobiales bacterium]
MTGTGDEDVVGVVDAEAPGVVAGLGLAGVVGDAGVTGVVGGVVVAGAVVAGATGVGGEVIAGSPLDTFTLVLLSVPEMWTLVMGALMLTFWNCMPMSPKPPSLPWAWLLEPTAERMSLPETPASVAELPPFEDAGEAFEDAAGAAGATGAAATTGAAGVVLGHVAGVEVVEARVALLAGWLSAR